MKKVFIISSAPIDYEIASYDRYDSFNLISFGKLHAPLQAGARNEVSNFHFPFEVTSIGIIMTAEGGQTFDTAEMIKEVKDLDDIKIIQTPNLNGIRFSMDQLVGKEEFIESYKTAIVKARTMFVEKFFKDQLLESRKSIEERMSSLIARLKELSGNVMCISHGFYMKLLEIYIKSLDKFESLESLIDAFEPTKKPYEPLQGFSIEL